jgi:uncharacterized membrane protein YgcG
VSDRRRPTDGLPPLPVTPVATTAATVRIAVAKAAPEPKRPYHLGVAVGLTTGAYALSLLVASSLQIDHDRALIVDRQPVADAIDVLGEHHDDMGIRLEVARTAYATGADGYGALITRLDAMRERLAKMDATVTAIERANGVLAASIPGVPGSVSRSGAGSSSGSSRGSGGGSSWSSSGSGSGAGAPRSVPAAPPPVAQPPTSGSTGASGAP